MPFTHNPFSKKKVDFTKETPGAPEELSKKRQLIGADDDKAISLGQDDHKPQVTERTIIKEAPNDGLPDFGA